MKKLTRKEEEVMKILWKLKKAFVKDIIEEYPDDKYSPSCLIYGQTLVRRDLHVQVSLPPKVVIITTYEPDPDEWVDHSIRR